MQLKFKEVPIGGRIFEYDRVWVVIENFGNGLIVEYTGECSTWLSHCSFVDEEENITLDSYVEFIG
jgi:hypothetical protein